MNDISVSRAQPFQANEVCVLIRRSILEISAADYNNDAAVIAAWLENKTTENIESRINDPKTYAIVAMQAGQVVGFGQVSPTRILLNYALPGYLGLGVGFKMLTTLEDWARNQGSQKLECISTVTALPFYERQGYVRSGEPVYYDGKAGDFPLSKTLGT
jgi:GNAT superfamily N-acetyltransferase